MMCELISSPTLAAAFGAGIHGGLHAADVALGQHGDEAAADGDGFDQA